MINYVTVMRRSDQKACINIQKRTFPRLQTYTDFASEVSKVNSLYLVAHLEKCSGLTPNQNAVTNDLCECKTSSKNVTGFIGSWSASDEIQIIEFMVHPKFRGFGIGRLLLTSLIDKADLLKSKLITLEVRESNKNALSLYKKFGFKISGVRKNYYSNRTEDAILMNLELKS